MRGCRTFLTSILALAVVGNTAGAMPCYCGQPVELARSCCEAATKVAAPRLCCAQKQAPISVAPSGTGCCCVQSTPASADPREGVAKRPAAEAPFAGFLPLPRIEPLFIAPSASRPAIQPYGAALRVFYCSWLN